MLVRSVVFYITSSSIIFFININRHSDIDGVVRDSSHSFVNTSELPQSSVKLSIYIYSFNYPVYNHDIRNHRDPPDSTAFGSLSERSVCRLNCKCHLWNLRVTHVTSVATRDYLFDLYNSPNSIYFYAENRGFKKRNRVIKSGLQRDNWRKLQMEDVSNLINICPRNPIPVLILYGFFRRFCYCPSIYVFDINKNSMSVLWVP